MRDALAHIVSYIVQLGGVGVLLVSLLDSSILFLPLSIDLLVIAVSANRGIHALYYAAMAAAGSVAGTAVIYFFAAKGGEDGLRRFSHQKQIEQVKRKLHQNARWALALAAILPPPFPYRVFVAVAAVGSYPMRKALLAIGGSRLARFSLEAILSGLYGQNVVRFMSTSDKFYFTLLGLGLLSLAGTGVSIYVWLKNAR